QHGVEGAQTNCSVGSFGERFGHYFGVKTGDRRQHRLWSGNGREASAGSKRSESSHSSGSCFAERSADDERMSIAAFVGLGRAPGQQSGKIGGCAEVES